MVDSGLDAINDIMTEFYKANFCPDEEAKKKLFEEFFGSKLPSWFERMENRLKANTTQNYMVGDKLTILDFAIAALAYSSFLNETNPIKEQQMTIVEKFPTFLDYTKRLGNEEFKSYIDSRPARPWWSAHYNLC